jgi:hypothetical protein
MKNLSPAKKFRLRLRLEKFQKRWQSREEYFEHDTRDNVQNKKNSNARKRKYYNNADNRNKSKRPKRVPNNVLNNLKTEENQTSSKIDTVNFMSGNAKSTFSSSSSHETTKTSQMPEDAKQNNNHVHSPTSSEIMKCCCHCSCARASKKLRKPRRKLSSPYLGDFDVLYYNNNNNNNAQERHGNCSNTASKLTVMTTTQHQQHHKYIEASTSTGSCSHFSHEQPKLVKYVAHKSIERKSSIEKKKIKNGKRF